MVDTFRTEGMYGFTRGMSASYVGLYLLKSLKLRLLKKFRSDEFSVSLLYFPICPQTTSGVKFANCEPILRLFIFQGITETVIALVLWEQFKKAIYETYGPGPINSAVAAAGAKLIATTVAYPHGSYI